MTLASVHSWLNGEIVSRESASPSIASISLHLGTGVFDGLVAYWNKDHYYIHRGEEHLSRFKSGASRMGLDFDWSVEDLMDACWGLLDREETTTQYIRPIAYRGAPELWITGSEGKAVDVAIFTVRMDRDIDAPVRCHISPIERISSRAIPGQTKVSGAYVNSFYARKTAESLGYQDGLMLDRQGRITEASAANFFAIYDDVLVTPLLNDDVFPGETRKVILEIAGKLGIAAIEKDLRVPDLHDIGGAFLCSTLMEIRPISCIDQKIIATVENQIYKSIKHSFRELTHGS